MATNINSVPSHRVELSTTVVQLGAIFFAILITLLHFLRPEQDIIGRPTSDYAVGEYGFLMSAAYIILSLTSLALIYSLKKSLTNPKKARVPFTFLFIWSVCLWIAMMFPIDLERSRTYNYRYHSSD